MAQQFYYQVSTLPMLRLGEPAGITPAAFDEFCEAQLPPAVAAGLLRLSLEPDGEPGTDVERGWQVWETYVRHCLVRLRAARLGVDAAPFLRSDTDVFPGDRRRVEEIYSDPDPLVREQELDRLRWQRLEDLAVEHYFDLEALVLYKLRLLLVARWAGRSAPAGHQMHEHVVSAAAQQAAARRLSTGVSIAT